MIYFHPWLITLALTTVLFFILLRSKNNAKRCSISPGWLPLLGHTYVLAQPAAHQLLRKWANTLGSIFRVDILTTPCYVISSADLAHKVLAARGPDKCLKAPQVYQPSFSLTFGTPSLFNDCEEGESYQAFRKGLAPAFSDKNMKAVLPEIRDTAYKLVAIWQGHPEAEAFVVSDWMQRVMLDVIGSAGFDLHFRALDGGFNPIFQAVHDAVLVYDRRSVQPLEEPLCRMLPMLPIAKEANRAMEKFRETFSGFLDVFRARGDPDPEDTRMWAHLMRVKDPSTGKPYPDAMIQGNIAILLVAGFDTSSWTATWALYDIARHPDVQQRISQELADAGLLQVPERAAARSVEWSDLALPYFNAVLKESMRLHPVAGIGTVRVAPHDMELGGVHVHKGNLLWIPIHGVHTSVLNFTEPTKFDPGRWFGPPQEEIPQNGAPTDNNSKASSTSSPPNPLQDGQAEAGLSLPSDSLPAGCPSSGSPASFPSACPLTAMATHTGHAAAQSRSMLPFSSGPRNCIGLNFAAVSVRTVLLSLLSSFWFDIHESLKDHKLVEESQVLILVLQSGIPIKLHLRPHTS